VHFIFSESLSPTSIQWFPGHMNVPRKDAAKTIEVIDVIVEVLDARIPNASCNPLKVQAKPRCRTDYGWWIRLIWLIWWIGLIWANLGESGATGRASAKLESRFVDLQCLDAMVKRGWWHPEFRRRP